jgi:hypothetical protein
MNIWIKMLLAVHIYIIRDFSTALTFVQNWLLNSSDEMSLKVPFSMGLTKF